MPQALKKPDRKLCTVRQFFNTDEKKRAGLMPIAVNDLGIQKKAGSKAIDNDARTASMIWSTATVDSMGDIIEPKGWDLKRFKRNPIICLNHDTYNLPIGRGLNVTKDADNLRGDVEFMPPEVYALAETVWQMVKGNWLKTGSVGFQPIEWEAMYDDATGHFKGYRFTKQSLYEFSVVTVPANPDAMVSAKAAGIDLRPLREDYSKNMDAWDTSALGLLVPRARVEAAWKAAGETFVRGASMEDDNDDDSSGDGSDVANRDGSTEQRAAEGNDGHDDRGTRSDRGGATELGDGGVADVERADDVSRAAGADDSASGEDADRSANEPASAQERSGGNGPSDDVQLAASEDHGDGDRDVDSSAERRAESHAGKAKGKEGEKAQASELVQKNERREVAGVVHVFDAGSGAYIGHLDPSGRLSVDKRAQDRVADANLDAINADHRARIEARRSISNGSMAVANSRKRAELALRRHALH